MDDLAMLDLGPVTKADVLKSNPLLVANTINSLRAENRRLRAVLTVTERQLAHVFGLLQTSDRELITETQGALEAAREAVGESV